MRDEVVFAHLHGRARAKYRVLQRHDAAARLLRLETAEADLALAGRQRQVDLGQQLRVEQGAVQLPMRVVDPEPLAQRIERIALAGVALAREFE